MCKRNLCVVVVVLALPVLTWADLLHPSISPIGLPILNSNTTGQSANVQVTGFSTDSGTNQAAVTVNSSQSSFNGLDGSTQSEESNLNVDYSGTGSVQVNEGGLVMPGLLGTSALGLGLSTGLPVGLGLGMNTSNMGLNSALLNTNMISMQAGLIGMQANMIGLGLQSGALIGQPVMMQMLLP